MQRFRKMQHFKSPGSAQRFLSVRAAVCPFMRATPASCVECEGRKARLLRIAVDRLDLAARTKHGEGSSTGQEGSGSETVVKRRHSALKSTAGKEPAAKIANALRRTESATRQKAKSERISLSMTRKKRAPAKKR